jgi:hypothetical protein
LLEIALVIAGPGDVIVKLLLGAQDFIEAVLDHVADADDAGEGFAIHHQHVVRATTRNSVRMTDTNASPTKLNAGDRTAMSERDGEQAHHDRIRWHRRF